MPVWFKHIIMSSWWYVYCRFRLMEEFWAGQLVYTSHVWSILKAVPPWWCSYHARTGMLWINKYIYVGICPLFHLWPCHIISCNIWIPLKWFNLIAPFLFSFAVMWIYFAVIIPFIRFYAPKLSFSCIHCPWLQYVNHELVTCPWLYLERLLLVCFIIITVWIMIINKDYNNNKNETR